MIIPNTKKYIPEINEQTVRKVLSKLNMKVRTQTIVDIVVGRYNRIAEKLNKKFKTESRFNLRIQPFAFSFKFKTPLFRVRIRFKSIIRYWYDKFSLLITGN